MSNKPYLLTLNKKVPNDKLCLYIANGWVSRDSDPNLLSTDISVNGHDRMDAPEVLYDPYVVHRFLINRPLGKFTRKGLFEAARSIGYNKNVMPDFQLTYAMCLRRIHASLFDYVLTKHDEIFIEVEEGQRFVMRIFSCLNDSQLQEYVGMIQQVINGELKSSSFLGLEDAVRRSKNSLPDIADFWVDVENDVALSFDKNFMIRLPFMLQRTIL